MEIHCGVKHKTAGLSLSLSQGQVPFVPGMDPVCPGHLPPKMFMLIVFFLPEG